MCFSGTSETQTKHSTILTAEAVVKEVTEVTEVTAAAEADIYLVSLLD
jgi:hypothetical protein